MKNSVFGKTMENVRKHRDNKFVTTEKRRLFRIRTKLNYHTTNLLAIGMKKKATQILMNKSLYLGLLILELSKPVMYEFWYDYVKPKYREKSKLRYMDTDNFIL